MSPPDERGHQLGAIFWKIVGAGAAFQAGAAAVDSATIVANLVDRLTGNLFAVGAASAVLRLGWLLPQIVVGFLAQRAQRSMPFYVVGAFGRAICLALIAVLLALAAKLSAAVAAGSFLVLWTVYAFVSGIVAVPYNDIVARSIPVRRPQSDAGAPLLRRRCAGARGRDDHPAPARDDRLSRLACADLRARLGPHGRLGAELRLRG